jgi:hypothetical protein
LAVVNDDIETAPGQAGEPVGRVRVAAEPEQWSNSAGDSYEGGWTLQRIALAVAIVLLMAGLLAFILWGAFQLGA